MQEDTLKPLSELCDPHPISEALARADLAAGTVRPKTLEDHYEDITLARLPHHVPEQVRRHFDLARHLLLYSWFVWDFRVPCQLYAYASLELALRIRAIQAREIKRASQKTLGPLLQIAFKRKWIAVSQLSEYRLIDANQKAAYERWSRLFEEKETILTWAPQVDPKKYTAILARYIPFARNELAHASPYIPGNPIGTLHTCSELIRQLFPEPP